MKSLITARPNPVEALLDDHKRATRLIRLLVEHVGGQSRLGAHDIEIAQSVFRYMVFFVDHQHHAREDHVIEMLAKRDPSTRLRVERAEIDHDLLKREGADILSILEYGVKRPAIMEKDLVRRLRHYGEILLKHFQYEETQLFSLAETLLLPEDWQSIERRGTASGDPLFGAEVEADFGSLFDVYVNRVREIGTPASRHATVPAAAFVDTAAAILSGSMTVLSALRVGSGKVIKANFAGYGALARSQSLPDFISRSLVWTRTSLDEANAMAGQVIDALHGTLRALEAPIAGALGSEFREFGTSYRPDKSSASWQAQFVNLALRATVKRMADTSSLIEGDLPKKNIEVPRTSIDRFIPALADDVEVKRIELENAFAEVISVKGVSPARTLLFFPGGGFMMAPTQAHRLLAARLARSAAAQVVVVHYRLAPEYRFPAGLDDCIEAYRALLEQGTPAKSIVLMGDSAGGGMALSALLQIRDAGLSPPLAGVLLSPVTDLSYSGKSRRGNSWNDPVLSDDEKNLMAQIYLGKTSKDDPIASPLFADLSGLPPILIQVGSTEVLLDDALRVSAKIRSQRGECECEVWHDMPHDWILFGMLPEARRALRRVVKFVDAKFTDEAKGRSSIRREGNPFVDPALSRQ